MPVLTYLGEIFDCARAQKGADFVRLLDENNNVVFSADGISDFTNYVLTDGEWETPIAVVAPIVGAYAVRSGTRLYLNLPSSVKVETDLQVNFKAPCDCSAIAGLIINGEVYDVVDALGNCVIGKGGAWATGALVGVVLDVEEKKAYLLSASGGISEEVAAKYGLTGANATADNAFDALARYLLGQGITTVTVLDEDGNPISGVTFSGAVGSSGEEVSTDASGIAQVVVTTDISVTLHTEYVDIPDYTVTMTPNFEEINAITVVMPYAESGHIETILDSGSVKFRKARTVDVALVGGGNGGDPGESEFATNNSGGSGGDGGNVYNVSKTVEAETAYSVVIGAGGVGLGRADYSDESVAAQNGGNTTAFGETSASGATSTLAFSDSSVMAGGKGGTGGKAPSGAGYDGVRCGGKGGQGGPSVSAGGYSYGSKGYKGSAPGGGGGGGGGRAYVSNGMNSVSGSSYAGDGGDGAAGGVLIKF